MREKNYAFFAKRSRTGLVMLRCRLFAGVTFLCLCAVPSALGGSSYSDAWVDSSGNNLWGCGVTQQSYTGAGHSAGVSTTITSPNGRSASYGLSGSTYARVDVSLPWDWNDMGTYFVNSNHYGYCPHYGGSSFAPTTSAQETAGYDFLCYKYSHTSGSEYVYEILDGCPGKIKCYKQFVSINYNAGMRAKSQQGWIKRGTTKICTGLQVPLQSGACDLNYCREGPALP